MTPDRLQAARAQVTVADPVEDPALPLPGRSMTSGSMRELGDGRGIGPETLRCQGRESIPAKAERYLCQRRLKTDPFSPVEN